MSPSSRFTLKSLERNPIVPKINTSHSFSRPLIGILSHTKLKPESSVKECECHSRIEPRDSGVADLGWRPVVACWAGAHCRRIPFAGSLMRQSWGVINAPDKRETPRKGIGKRATRISFRSRGARISDSQCTQPEPLHRTNIRTSRRKVSNIVRAFFLQPHDWDSTETFLRYSL